MDTMEREKVQAECQCDEHSWAKDQGPICDTPEFDDAIGICFNCSHDRRCHKDYWELFGKAY